VDHWRDVNTQILHWSWPDQLIYNGWGKHLDRVALTLTCYTWIYSAQGNHWQSLHYFLELGIVTTDFFTEPVTKNIYNDQVCTQRCELSLKLEAPHVTSLSLIISFLCLFRFPIFWLISPRSSVALRYFCCCKISSLKPLRVVGFPSTVKGKIPPKLYLVHFEHTIVFWRVLL